MKSHYHGATWILLRDHDIHFCCLIYFPTYHHLKTSMVKWLWSAAFVLDNSCFIYEMHCGCQSTAPNGGAIPLWRLNLSALSHQLLTACISRASHRSRDLNQGGSAARQKLWKMWRVLLCLRSFLVSTLIFCSLLQVVPPPQLLCRGGVNCGVDICWGFWIYRSFNFHAHLGWHVFLLPLFRQENRRFAHYIIIELVMQLELTFLRFESKYLN